MRTLKWEANEWRMNDKRYVSIRLWMNVRAYVRQTRYTRFGSGPHGKYARDYVENQGALRDSLTVLMRHEGYEKFGKVPLGCSISVYGPKATRPDLSNLEKAVEDAANGSVWVDDRYVYERGTGRKGKAKDDLLELTVWEL